MSPEDFRTLIDRIIIEGKNDDEKVEYVLESGVRLSCLYGDYRTTTGILKRLPADSIAEILDGSLVSVDTIERLSASVENFFVRQETCHNFLTSELKRITRLERQEVEKELRNVEKSYLKIRKFMTCNSTPLCLTATEARSLSKQTIKEMEDMGVDVSVASLQGEQVIRPD